MDGSNLKPWWCGGGAPLQEERSGACRSTEGAGDPVNKTVSCWPHALPIDYYVLLILLPSWVGTAIFPSTPALTRAAARRESSSSALADDLQQGEKVKEEDGMFCLRPKFKTRHTLAGRLTVINYDENGG